MCQQLDTTSSDILEPLLQKKEADHNLKTMSQENVKHRSTHTHLPRQGTDTSKESGSIPLIVQLAESQSRTRNLPPFIILHYSPFKAVWDWVILLLVLYTALFTPYIAAFLLHQDKVQHVKNQNSMTRSSVKDSNRAGFLVVLDLIVDVIFTADILINFRTTYVDNGEVISDPQKIAANYLKGWFLVDMLAAVPFDLLLFGAGGSSDSVTIIAILKAARLLRLMRVARRIDQYSEYGAAVILLMMGCIALVCHWLACIFYAIAYVEKEGLTHPIGWLDTLARMESDNETYELDIQTKYITALYFTFTTVTSIGFGNISANTNAEKIFTIVGMLLGSLISAAIFGNISSLVLRLYQGTDEFHERTTGIREFIKFHKIPTPLAHKLEESFVNRWNYTNGIDMNSVLKSFPECLQADICLHMNRNLLNTWPAFHGATPGCLRAFAMKFRTLHVPPGDTLVHADGLVEAIFIIARGTIEIVQEDVVIAILGQNDVFGVGPEHSLTNSLRQSLFTVRALSYVDLNKITLGDLCDILLMYPEWASKFINSFAITFDLSDTCPSAESDVLTNSFNPNMDEETLKFIKQKRPKLQMMSQMSREDQKRIKTQQKYVRENSTVIRSTLEFFHSQLSDPGFQNPRRHIRGLGSPLMNRARSANTSRRIRPPPVLLRAHSQGRFIIQPNESPYPSPATLLSPNGLFPYFVTPRPSVTASSGAQTPSLHMASQHAHFNSSLHLQRMSSNLPTTGSQAETPLPPHQKEMILHQLDRIIKDALVKVEQLTARTASFEVEFNYKVSEILRMVLLSMENEEESSTFRGSSVVQ